MAVEITTDFSAAGMVQYRKEALDFLRTKLYFHRSALKATLDKHSGDTVRAYRVDTLSAATTPLTEGAVPSTQNITSSLFTAQILQYGSVNQYSDMLDLVGPSDVSKQFGQMFGYQGALTVDTLTMTEYISGATIVYANNSDSGSFDATSTFSSKEIRRSAKRFRAKKVNGFLEDDLYRLYLHPDCEFDVVTDDTYGSLTDLQKRDPDPKKWQNVVAVYGQHAVFTTSLITTATVNGVTAYKNIAVGYGALMAYDLAGMPFQVFNSPPSNINQANPIGQIGAIGWKCGFVADYIGSDGPRAYQIYAAATEPTA
jgi:N4-gp56 family major capsid protein